MGHDLRQARVKKVLRILEEYCYQDCDNIMQLQGEIWDDEYPQQKSPVCIEPGKISFTEKRNSFYLRAGFQAKKKEGYETLLILELGTSRSLEALSFLYGPEAVVSIDGQRVSGLDPNHSQIILEDRFLDGRVHSLTLEGWTGIREEYYEAGCIAVCRVNPLVRKYTDLCALCCEAADALMESEHLYAAVMDSMLCLNLYEPLGEIFLQSVEKAYEILENWLEENRFPERERVIACGHGHLDLAWLWRTEQAKKKGVRTFLNVIALMKHYPEFRFSQTQAQLYQWIEKEDSRLFQYIQEAVRRGQWEILGGMWVEPDCNLTGAESLVRQFLLFSQYMNKRFGTKGSQVVWLPDTFGFCGQLPQLMKSAGYQYFATAKLTWNQYNKMPSEYFWWEGIDGSRVLSYIVSTSKPGWWGATYSADLTPEELVSTLREREAKTTHTEMLTAFGMGDGGGGPTEKMVRRGQMLKKLPIPGLPGIKFGTFEEFFQKLEREQKEQLPIWMGELYFELHRGTYTSQAEIKRNNRLCETALHEAEFLAAFASVETKFSYPSDALKEAWETVCLNQFHDILPGSSIGAVYKDAKKDHEKVKHICADICRKAVEALESSMEKGASYAVINTTSFWQDDVVSIPVCLKPGQCLKTKTQILRTVSHEDSTYAYVHNIPPYGYMTLFIAQGESSLGGSALYAGYMEETLDDDCKSDAVYMMYNEKVKIELDKNGDIIRYLDKEEHREIVPEGSHFAQWQMYEDRPVDWDAWDIDEDYGRKGYQSARLIQIDPYYISDIRAGFYIRKSIGNSAIVQNIYICSDKKDIMAEIELDYQESYEQLRLSFPLRIHNSAAVFGIPFGSTERNTHYNTSWDRAKFETYMHRWADYSEGGYGIGLVCDNKYGISIHHGIISLAVSKSPGFPDKDADRGEQKFTFAIVPHKESERWEVIRKGYLKTNPLKIYSLKNARGSAQQKSMIASTNENIVIETVKQAEDKRGIIARAYECGNSRGRMQLQFCKQLCEVHRCSILEECTKDLEIKGNKIVMDYNPYEIITLRMQEDGNESIDHAQRQENSIR